LAHDTSRAMTSLSSMFGAIGPKHTIVAMYHQSARILSDWALNIHSLMKSPARDMNTCDAICWRGSPPYRRYQIVVILLLFTTAFAGSSCTDRTGLNTAAPPALPSPAEQSAQASSTVKQPVPPPPADESTTPAPPAVKQPAPVPPTVNQPAPAPSTVNQPPLPSRLVLRLGGPDIELPMLTRRTNSCGNIPVDTLPTDSFERIPVGTVSKPHVIVLELDNAITCRVTVTNVHVDNASFLVTDDRCTGTNLSATASRRCTFGIVFKPRGAGQKTARITAMFTHVCTSNQYWPCNVNEDEVPPDSKVSIKKNARGDKVIRWGNDLVNARGEGTA
jgi:hypothetical protein